MSNIKLRNIKRGTVKMIDRSSMMGCKLKDAYTKIKDKAENGNLSDKNTVNEYSVERLQKLAVGVATKSIRQFANKRHNNIKYLNRDIKKVNKRAKGIKEFPQKVLSKENKIKISKSNRTIKTKSRTNVKITNKNSKTTIKTSNHTGKVIIKTTKTVVQSELLAVKVKKRTVKTFLYASTVAVKTLFVTIKATVKSIIEDIKCIVAIIVSVGWIAGVIIVVISFVALILCSYYDILLAREYVGTVATEALQQVIQEIEAEFNS